MEIILKDNTYYDVEQADLIYWTGVFSNVDVYREVMVMGSWSLSNPGKRKTKAGIKRFINAWLSKAQKTGKSIDIPLHSRLADVTWVIDPVLRIESQAYFLDKYGFYYLNGEKVIASPEIKQLTTTPPNTVNKEDR